MGAAAAASEVAQRAAERFGITVAIRGATDYVADGQRLIAVDNGHVWLTTLTGTGCAVSALVGACAAAATDPVVAAVAGLASMGIAAERAATRAQGPGSFKVALQDALYHLQPQAFVEQAKIRELTHGDGTPQ